MVDSLVFNVKTEKRHIAYVNFIIEAYDGIAVVRTADPEAGLLEVLVAPDLEPDFRALANALDSEVGFKIIEQYCPAHESLFTFPPKRS